MKKSWRRTDGHRASDRKRGLERDINERFSKETESEHLSLANSGPRLLL